MRNFAALVATQENLEVATGGDGNEVQVANTTAEVAEASADVSANVAEIEQVDANIDSATASQDKVAELTEIAEASLAGEGEEVAEGEVGQEGEGLSEKEAALVEITHESIMQSLGFDVQRNMYTRESFGSVRGKREVTMEALDNLKASAKKLGEGIVKALKAALEMVIGFVAKIINNRALMERHLNNLAKRVNDVAGDAKLSKDKLTVSAAALSFGGKANAETAVRVINGMDECLNVATKYAEALYRDKSATELSVDSTNPNAMTLSNNGEGQGVLGGGKAFKLIKGEDGGLKFDIIEVGGVVNEIAAPNKSEMAKVLAAAKQLLSKLRDAEKIRSRLQDVVAAIKSMAERGVAEVTSRVGTEKSKAEGSAKKSVNIKAATVRSFMTRFVTTTFSNSFRVIKASADYVNAGLKNLGAAGETAPAEQAAAA